MTASEPTPPSAPSLRITATDHRLLKRSVVYCDEIIAMQECHGDNIAQDRFLRYAVARLVGQLGRCVGNLTLDFRETFPSLPYREITSAKFEICGKQLDSNLNVVGQYLRDGAVVRWRAAFVDVLSDWRFPSSDDAAGHQTSPDKNEPGNAAQMRDHEYRSVIKEYLLNRVAAPDKFQYIGLRELVHDLQLAAYRTKLNIWFQSAPHRFRKHLIGRILDETSSNHSSALSELFCIACSPAGDGGSNPNRKTMHACLISSSRRRRASHSFAK